jgi:hypothetical protein
MFEGQYLQAFEGRSCEPHDLHFAFDPTHSPRE